VGVRRQRGQETQDQAHQKLSMGPNILWKDKKSYNGKQTVSTIFDKPGELLPVGSP